MTYLECKQGRYVYYAIVNDRSEAFYISLANREVTESQLTALKRRVNQLYHTSLKNIELYLGFYDQDEELITYLDMPLETDQIFSIKKHYENFIKEVDGIPVIFSKRR